MDELVLPPLIPLENYVETEGKLAASLRWLILRVYEQEHNIPDRLRHGIHRDDMGRLHIDPAVLAGLTNGSLYAQAAAKIFKEPLLVNKAHDQVLAALTDYGIDVVQNVEEGGLPVAESDLNTANPFRITAHLGMMDALMMAHLRNVITVERVVDAVSRHTNVDDRERPMDATDALLFWINKICLLLRDEVEHAQIQLKGSDDGGMIPEMEDLYDEISDGQCLCALVAFYRKDEMNIEDICFLEKVSTPNCQYNLLLLREFCKNFLTWNPFHMEIEDILYMHDSMQMNINIFLADLFDIFEPALIRPPQPEVAQSPRRFIPIQGIPDLRAANLAARSPHPPRVRNPFSNIHVTQTPSRSMSVMSQDSLTYQRRPNPFQKEIDSWGENATNFGKLAQSHGSNGNMSQTGSYTRSDSLPAASVRLALEEKRREHEKRKQFDATATEAERQEKSKAAFFALMNQAKPKPENLKLADENQQRMIELMTQKIGALEERLSAMNLESNSARMSRALSQPSVYQDLAPHSARPDFAQHTLPHSHQMQAGYGQPYDAYGYQNQQGHYAQPQQLRSSLSNGMINYLPGQAPQYDYQPQMQHAGHMPVPPNAYGHSPDPYSQPPQYGGQQHMHQQQPGFSLMHQSAHASTGFSMHPQQPAQPGPYGMSGPNGYPQFMSPLDMAPHPQQAYEQQQPFYGGASTPSDQSNGFEQNGTFVLHSQEASSSRLDPSLELNRNLTNWGMTVKADPSQPQGHTGRPLRRGWENQTFVKNDMDRVNHPDMLPVIDSDDLPQQRRSSSSVVGSIVTRRSRDSRDDTSMDSDRLQIHDPEQFAVQASPPRDPGNSSAGHNGNGSILDSSRSSLSAAPPGPAFVVSDDHAAEDFDKIAEQRREAKKAALLAKTMKRREEKDDKLDLLEQRNQERRIAEDAKREMADQRKIEKELQRQKILDEYKRKKVEKELGLEPSSARGPPGRGHSQPPFVRAKSQMSEDVLNSGRTPRSRGASTVEQRVTVASLQEPTHKLFAKATTKTNRSQILNSLSYSIFPGKVNDPIRIKTTNDLAASAAKHFLILFRDHKCQFRGLYTWDQQSDTVERVSGQGPAKCREDMMNLMFKYDSGSKGFSQIPCKHLGATIDGFSIQDSYWQKPKIPHSTSGGATHKNN